jgi:hypothetical protein
MSQIGSPFNKPPIPSPAQSRVSAPIVTAAPPPPRSGSSFVMWGLIAGLGIVAVAVIWFGLSRQQAPTHPAVASTSGMEAAPSVQAKPVQAKPRLTAEERKAANEAVTALKALKSATSVGVTYAEYMRRLADTKIVVDHSSALLKTPTLSTQIDGAMTSYELVGSAWDAKIQKRGLESYLSIAGDCGAAKDVLSRAASEKYPFIVHEVYAVPTLMTCASERLATLAGDVDALTQ